MKNAYFYVVLSVVALTLASASTPCQAGSVTYDFVEGDGAPHPSMIGATITVSSPPASSTAGWNSRDPSAVLGVQIIDSELFPNSFTGLLGPVILVATLLSPSGTTLISGSLMDQNFTMTIGINPGATVFFATGAATNPTAGSWVVSESVPEPASAVQAGIACAIGLALAAFRKRKEARRQRPVGPLAANQ